VTEYLFCLYTALLMFPSFSIACSVTDFILWTRITAARTEHTNDWTTRFINISTEVVLQPKYSADTCDAS